MDDLASCLDAASTVPLTVAEVFAALGVMAQGKSAGNAVYSLDIFNSDTLSLYQMVAELFTFWACSGYPHKLNTLLLLPLYKQRGDGSDCDNYRGISLLHPVSRWFSKALVTRLEADPAAVHACGQAGFCRFHRVEDKCLILQTLLQLAAG